MEIVEEVSQKYDIERKDMVWYQLTQRGIQDQAVINAMRKVPRHLFVPSALENMAYNDCALPIGYNQTISQPYIVALMTEAANLSKEDVILEIGTGSGYQAAVAAEICKEVYSLEVVKPLAEQANNMLHQLGYNNVHVAATDGNLSIWKDYGVFDAILVTASGAPSLLTELLKQLKIGGRIIMPIEEGNQQELVRITKTDQAFKKEYLGGVRFVPLTGNLPHSAE